MKVQGHLRNYPVTDLFKILAIRRESGCLRIEFDQPALLYFNKGQLVAARIADLEGISAIRLACSRATAPFVFDNAILPPAAENIDENDRLMLSRVFGLVSDVPGDPLPTSTRPVDRVAIPAPVARNTVQQPEMNTPGLGSTVRTQSHQANPEPNALRPIHKRQTSNFAGSLPRPRVPLRSSFVIVERQFSSAVARSFKDFSNLLAVTKQTFDYLPSRKLLRAAAVILVIAVPATVGLTLRLGRRGPAAPVVVEARETTLAEAPNPTIVSRVENNLPATPAAETPAPTPTKVQVVESSVSPGSKTAAPLIEKNTRSATTSAPLSDEPKIIEESARVAQPSAAVVEEAKPAPVVIPERKPESVSKTIVVVVRVEEGRVTEAWVRDSRRGSEAFEATAIRLARQRRYSKDTSRTESVPINVTVNQ